MSDELDDALFAAARKRTTAPAADDGAFRAAYADIVKKRADMGQPLDADPDNPEHKYDYRAAFKAGQLNMDEAGHFPSAFKADDHPNRFIGGVDTRVASPPEGDPVADALFAAAAARTKGQHPGMKRALRDYTPDLPEQDRRMEGDSVVSTATKRAIATDPALSTASLLVGGAADAAGIPIPGAFSPAAQAEFLAKQAASDPGAAAELDARALMAKGGIPGATMAGARGLAGGAEAVFSLVPGVQGVGQVGKGVAATVPKMLLPAAAGAAAPAIPGMDTLTELPAAGGRAAARALGAEAGGAAEALGGTAGAILPAFGPLAFAKGAGRSMAGPGVEPAFRVGQTPLGRLGPAVAAEGGLGSILRKSPTLGYEAANIGAMLPQSHIAPEASRAATGFGADPGTAELIGQMTGLGATLPIAAMEGKIAASGVRQGMEQAASAKAAADAKALASKEAAELKVLRTHEAPMEPTPDQRDTAYLREMEAKDAERKRALAGVAGAVEGARTAEQAKVDEAFPPVPPQPKVAPPKVTPVKSTEGPGMDPVAYAEALEQGVPLTPAEEAINAEARKPLDEFRATKMRDADRAASDLANREALHDATAEKWDAMDAEERKAVVARIPPGILRTAEVGRSFDKFRVDQKEHIAEALRDPGAFAEAMPVEEVPAPAAKTPAATAPERTTADPGGVGPRTGGAGDTQPPADAGPPPKTVAATTAPKAGAKWKKSKDFSYDGEHQLLDADGRVIASMAYNAPGGPHAGGWYDRSPSFKPRRGPKGEIDGPEGDFLGFNRKDAEAEIARRYGKKPEARAEKAPPAVAGPPAPPKKKGATKPDGGTWADFLKSKGIGILTTDDPRYKGLYAEFSAGKDKPPPAPIAPAAEGQPPTATPPAPTAPRAEAPPPPAPTETKAAAKARKFYETRLRSNGEVSVKGDKIRVDSSGKTYRVIVNDKEVFTGSPTEAFARADQEIARAAKGQVLGSGLGAIDFDNPSVRRVIRGTLGGATGYIVGVANDEPDDTPTGRAARRALWTAAGVGAATGVPGWQRFVSKPAGRLMKKAQPDWFRDYFGNPNERISETVAAIERGNLDKMELGKTQAHIEAMRAPDLKGSQARIYQDYLRGDPKAKEVFPRLVEHIRKTNPELADAMESGADFYKPESRARTAREVELGIRSEEAATEYGEGHVQRVYQKDSERPARPHGVNRGKVRMGEKAKDAPYWEGHLDPVTVELLMDEYGLPKPTGENTYFRGTEEGGTLVKWFPDAEGEKARQDFLAALSLYAKENAVKPISAGKIVGGGDDRMVVQVGKGSRADIGHLVGRVPEKPNELLVRAPRAIANEIVKTLGLETPKVTSAGSRLRYTFKDAGEVARFEDAVRELAVEGSTFNVTPAAKAYFRNRLKGAMVKSGPGQSGGIGHLTKDTGPAMNLRERRQAGEVYNPKAVTYKSSYEQARRIANAEMWNDYATKSDEHGPFAAEIPVDEDGTPLVKPDKDGFFKTEDGTEYKLLPKDKSGKENWGALAGKGLRRDVFEFKTEQRAIEESSRGFVRGMLTKWKSLKTGTPVWAALNIPSDLAFSYAADTSPVGGPSNWKSYWEVGKDFLRYIRTGDPSHVKRHVEGPGIRFHERMTTGDADADAALESIMFGAKESAPLRSERRGEAAMDILSLGTLAGRTAKTGAALGAAGGAAAGAAVGLAEGDDWDEILKRAGKGAAIGAGANLTARSIRKTGPLIDAYFKAVAYDIMTKRQGYSHAEARARVRKFFQNYEEPSKAVRIMSGRTGNPLAGAVVNPFLSFYSELLRIGGNAVAENPVRAAAILGAIPVAATVYNHYAGTFPDAEEGRAAKANTPTGIVGRTKDGGLASAELGRVNPGSDLLADIYATAKSPNKDTFRRIVTTFGGSTPILNLYDAGKTYFTPDNRDFRTGMEIRRPGETPLGAGVRHGMATLTSPLAPEFGTTEQFVEKSITEPYARGRYGDDSRPDRAITQALTGVRIKDIDFDRIHRSRRGQLDAEHAELERALDKALSEANIRANPDEVDRLRRQYREDYIKAIDRYREDVAKKTPQPVGGRR